MQVGATLELKNNNFFHRYTVPLGPVCDYYTEVGCHNCEETCAANNCRDLDCDTSTDCNCSDCKVDNDCPTGEQCCDRQCASSCGPTDPPATTTTTKKPTQPPTTTTTPCPTECCSDDDCEVSHFCFGECFQRTEHAKTGNAFPTRPLQTQQLLQQQQHLVLQSVAQMTTAKWV